MHEIIAIAAGSALGGILRYLLSRLVNTAVGDSFPWGTLAVNILGCLAIGLIYGLLDRGFQLSRPAVLFLTVGLCGGFTTFSTFVHENYALFASPVPLQGLLYIAASVLFGLAAAYLGHFLARL